MSESTIRPLPVYMQGATIYQIFLRAFTVEGTLSAAAKMLDHLAQMGVAVVYLTPIAEADDDTNRDGWSPRQKDSGMDNPKNPYRTKDFYRIDPEYGTENDLRDFVRHAHQLGLKVILDLVFLHCGPNAVFLEKHPDFVQRWKDDGSIKTNEWNFLLLNFDNADLREYLFKNMEDFITAFDVDGYRCDMAGEIPLDFWENARRRIDALKPDLFMLSETEGRPKEQRLAFDAGYGAAFSHKLVEVIENKSTASDLRKVIDKQDTDAPGGRRLRSFDNHDIANNHMDSRPERHCPPEATNCAMALCFSLEGIPFLYNGQEVADGNRHSIWSNREHGHNNIVDWSNALTAKGRERMAFVRTLIALRKGSAALAVGTRQWLENDQSRTVLSFIRIEENDTILAVFNLSASPLTVTVKAALELFGAEPLLKYGAHLRDQSRPPAIDLLPYGYLLLKQTVL
ncbi:glycosidase [Opitutaceae bacterium TAV1]|nr:glycosidase [Opitutaceae bacterium TAV1]